MTTSSSDVAEASPPPGVRARLTLAVPGVKSRLPVRVVDRTPPPPPVPKFDVTPLARALEAGFAQARAQVDAALVEIERGCVELALTVAQRVVGRRCERGELELEAPLQAMLAARRRELEESAATLRLHPEDAKLLEPKLNDLAPPGSHVAIVADPAQARGSLSLEIGAARLTRTLADELARLRARLLSEAD